MEKTYYIIDSLADFIRVINDVKSENCLNEENFYYRGQANSSWRLEPSLFRIGVENETNLIKNALYRFPHIFEHYTMPIEQLVAMQHYGLPTRLLDVTQNPLVALYFTCSELFDIDGVVYYLINKIDSNCKKANTIAHLIFNMSEGYEYDFENSKKTIGDINVSDDVLMALLTEPFYFQPPLDNDRIRAQQGAFVMPPLFETHYANNELYQKETGSLDNLFANKPILIKAHSKKTILKDLDSLGINEATIYPDAEHQMRYVKWKIEEESIKSQSIKLY